MADTPGSFRALCGVGFLARFSYTLSRNPAVPRLAESMGANDAQIGFAASASTWTGALLKLPAGVLSDLWGRRLFLLLSLLLFAGMPFAYLGVRTYAALVVVRFVHGLATALYGPVAMAFVAEHARDRRGERLGVFTAITAAGSLLAPVTAGVALDWAARDPLDLKVRNFAWIFYLSGIAGGAALLLGLAVLRRRTGPAPAVPRTWGRIGRGLREVLSDRRILLTSLVEASVAFASNGLATFLPLYVALIFEMPNWFAGLLLTVQASANLAARPLLGRAGDRWGRRPLVIAGVAVVSLPVVLMWIAPAPWMLLVLMLLFGLGESVVNAASAALVADVCGARNFGAAMGAFGTILDVGEAGGPVVLGLLKEHLSRRGLPDRSAYLNTFAPLGLLLVTVGLAFALFARGGNPAAPASSDETAPEDP